MKAAIAWRIIPAILLLFLFLDRATAAQNVAGPRSLVLGTGSPGGPYYAYGEGLARILTRTLKIETTAQVTQGPAQNIVLMEKKEAMLGFITMGAGLQAWLRYASNEGDARAGLLSYCDATMPAPRTRSPCPAPRRNPLPSRSRSR